MGRTGAVQNTPCMRYVRITYQQFFSAIVSFDSHFAFEARKISFNAISSQASAFGEVAFIFFTSMLPGAV